MNQTVGAAERRGRTLGPYLVDTADLPGGGRLRLVCGDGHYEMLVGSEQLMGSWDFRSEEALASLVAQRLGRRAGRILIGGLGMGFTLRAALATLPIDATIVVAELVPQVVAWAGGPLAGLFGDALSDPRVSVLIRDVHDVIVEHRTSLDAILLDIDNGPEGLVSLGNERLYSAWGLRTMRAALRPGGILAIWSAFPDASFRHELTAAGYDVDEVTIDAGHDGDEPPHRIWLARKS